MLHIITAAEKRFEPWVKRLSNACTSLGYNIDVYDLGNLGFGKRLAYSHLREHFCITGSYPSQNHSSWIIRACHKPEIVLNALTELPGCSVAYLDADCIIRGRIDETIGDYDIGVTVRRPGELRSATESHRPFMGQINAGVIFFQPSKATYKFVRKWKQRVETEGSSDQRILNEMLNPTNTVLESNVVRNVDGLRVRTFSTDVYNFYYFNEGIPATAKILHFKGSGRADSYREYLKLL